MFSQMSFAERAKYLGLRPSGSSWAQTTSANAAMLRQTARFNTSAAEAAAESFFAAAAAARASSRAAPAQEEEIPDWTLVLPGIKNQGGECSNAAAAADLLYSTYMMWCWQLTAAGAGCCTIFPGAWSTAVDLLPMCCHC